MRVRTSLSLVSVALGLAMALLAPGCGGGTTSGTDAASNGPDAASVDSGIDAASAVDSALVPDTGTDAAVVVDAATDDTGGPRSCGGRGGGTCLTNEFCSYTIADICGRADATGVCAVIPDACATGTAEVCGCDATTYPSECFANAAGTSVDHLGPCI